MGKQPGAVVVDARPQKAFDKGHVDGAINLPAGLSGKTADKELKKLLDAGKLPADKNTAIVTHCEIGGEGNNARKALMRAGFTNVKNGKSTARVKKLRDKALFTQ